MLAPHLRRPREPRVRTSAQRPRAHRRDGRRHVLARQCAARHERRLRAVGGERKEHDVGIGGVTDRRRQGIVEAERRDHHALGRGFGPVAEGSRHGDVQAGVRRVAVVDERPMHLLAGQPRRDQGTAGEVAVVLLGIVRPRQQDALLVGHEDPRRPDEVPVFLGLIEHLCAAAAREQALAELWDLPAGGADDADGAGAGGQEVLSGVARVEQAAMDRGVRGAVGLHRRHAERHA